MRLDLKLDPMKKPARKQEIKAMRLKLEDEPIEVELNGEIYLFDVDDRSEKRMKSQLRRMEKAGNPQIDWKLADDRTARLSSGELASIETKIQEAKDERISQLHNKYQQLLNMTVVTKDDIKPDKWGIGGRQP